MSKKKILYVHHGKGLGGAPLSLLYLIENLDKTKYEPIVLFLHDSQVLDLYKSKGIKVFGPVDLKDFAHTKIFWYRWYHAHIFLKSCLDSFRVIRSVANFWLDKIKPDIVHLNTSSLIAWAKIAHKKNIPVVFHVREPLANGYLGLRKRIIKKCVEKYSTKIVPICKNDSRPWIDSPKVNVIYNVVDSKIFDKNISEQDFLLKYNLSQDKPKILFLGGLSQEKGTLEILKIFQDLLKIVPNAQLLIAGYFDLKLNNVFSLKRYFPVDRYKINVARVLKNVRSSVVLLGPITNVPEAMAASQVLVFPATVGHFARPVIEAGFMAKPVIASCLAPLDELVFNNKTGFLIDMNNRKLWVKKLSELLLDKKLNMQMGENAHRYCLQKFNLDLHLKKIESMYAEK